ncbi:FAD synthetase family protein [Sporosarcina sp. 179-K 3D1 HS]|uniref:cytidyltransferase n=1 Tax=Sporosarcina sp. 179-K 3D1 HS TaxID=3232169 RepID=UPI0039A3237B
MEVIYLDQQHREYDVSEPAVLALGFFDGVHIGHRCLIEQARELTKREELQLAVMTFYPHPKEVLGGRKFDYLMSLEGKIEKMKGLGVERLYIVEFTKEFARLSPEQFVQDYIVDKHVKHVVAGFDYTYGHRGKGNMDMLTQLGKNRFDVSVLPKVVVEDRKISSSYIRELLTEGEVDSIKLYMGSEYETQGIIGSRRIITKEDRFSLLEFVPTEGTMLPKEGMYQIKMNEKSGIAFVYFNEKNAKTVAVKIENSPLDKLEGSPITFKWLALLESGESVAEKEISYS